MITLLRWGPRGDRTPCATMCRTCLCNANGGMNHGHNVRECPITIPGDQVVAGSNPVSPTTNTLPTSAGRGVLVEEARGDPNRAGRNLKLAPSAPCTQHRARPGPPLGQVDLGCSVTAHVSLGGRCAEVSPGSGRPRTPPVPGARAPWAKVSARRGTEFGVRADLLPAGSADSNTAHRRARTPEPGVLDNDLGGRSAVRLTKGGRRSIGALISRAPD